MGLVDRLIGRVADQVASRLSGSLTDQTGPTGQTSATARVMDAAFSPKDFGPGLPLTPREPLGTSPRVWQFPVGTNLSVTPRGQEPTSFEMLRNLADYCDLVRICVEMQKNQLVGLDWDIVAKEEGDSGNYAEEIKAASLFFEKPDRESPWDAWLRMLLEDLLVLDAPSIYRRRTRNGQQLYALEIVDGSSIKPLLDGRGRTPAPPLPAYQQILYGFPSTDLTTDELLYRPKNRRARSAYGSSPVEWILLAVNWYLRREQFNLGYYTFGNVPEGFVSAPEGWSPEQIRQFEEWFNAVVTGNVEEMRKLRFVGHGATFTRFRDMNFEVAHEEWLARVITAAFGVNYQRFVQRVVRATAEVAASQQADEGLDPLKRWVSGLITEVLARDVGMPFLKHQFRGGEAKDEKALAEKNVLYVKEGIFARDEVREDEGKDPKNLPLTKGLTVTTASGVVALDGAVGAGGSGSGGDRESGRAGDVSLSPDRQVTQSLPDATKAAQADLTRWRRKALKAFREGKAERAVEFVSTCLAPGVHAAVVGKLAVAKSESAVLAAFDVKSDSRPATRGSSGRAPRLVPNRTTQQDPEILRRIQDIVARRFRAQAPAVMTRAHELHTGTER